MKKQTEIQSLSILIGQCRKDVRQSQKELYKMYYSYGLTVCLHYSKNREEAEEILNDGFVKVFARLGQYKFGAPFKSWLRKVLVRSAIDYYRKFHHKKEQWQVVHLQQEASVENEAIYNLSMKDALLLLQELPPRYRMVFNLFVLEGYSHSEIANLLNIEVGTSKSNLAKAKKKLQKLVSKFYEINIKVKFKFRKYI